MIKVRLEMRLQLLSLLPKALRTMLCVSFLVGHYGLYILVHLYMESRAFLMLYNLAIL